MYEFKLPDLGEGIHEGEILKWLVKPGDVIEEDAPLVEVETDKAAVTIPSPKAGRILSLGAPEGAVVTVGQVLVSIDDGTGGAAPPAKVKEEKAPAPEAPPAVPKAEAQPSGPGKPAPGPRPAAPATRRLARELGVDLSAVPATGPGGRITPEDVQAFAKGKIPPAGEAPPARAAAGPAPPPGGPWIPFLEVEPLPDFSQWGPVEKEPLRSIRRKVARKMVTSMVLVPHVAHMDDADVTLLEEFRLKEKERRAGGYGGKLTLLPFVVKAVTAGLKAAPAFNASLDPFSREVIYKKYYHIGIACDTGRGLVVPVIRDTDRKSIIQISAEIEEAARKAREGNLKPEEMRGGTFTITNVGPLGGTALIPAINYPEVAILGMGRVQEKPVVREGEIVARKILPLTLAFDHRIADGADAARFVGELVKQLSDPNLLLLET